jgi:hypothetical protein
MVELPLLSSLTFLKKGTQPLEALVRGFLIGKVHEY